MNPGAPTDKERIEILRTKLARQEARCAPLVEALERMTEIDVSDANLEEIAFAARAALRAFREREPTMAEATPLDHALAATALRLAAVEKDRDRLREALRELVALWDSWDPKRDPGPLLEAHGRCRAALEGESA